MLAGENVPPCASPVNAVNRTMTNTSSTDAPARINCGILFLTPYPFSIRFSIFGTITAGDTAPTTAPMMAASNTEIPRSRGAKRIIPIISKQAGVLHIDMLHTRLFGAKMYVDIEISADGTLSLEEGHEIAQKVHDAVEKEFPLVKHCMVHVNPV